MTVETTLQKMFDRYPLMYSTREECFDHLFCTIGNGYEWKWGQLVDRDRDDPDYDVVSMTINRCIMVFKTKIWNEKSRELYDNTASVVRDLALVIGGTCAMLFCPDLKTSLILWGVACLADDIGWIMTWLKLKDVLEEN